MYTRCSSLLVALVASSALAACSTSNDSTARPASADCGPAGAPTSSGSDAATEAAPSGAAIDPAAVTAATGGSNPETSEGMVKVSFPRNDLPIEVEGWKMAPFMGLTSWAAFSPSGMAGMEAMVMGDLVVLEDEVNPVMSAALDNGLEVTALHNHFFFDKPHVYFMHIGGMGSVSVLGKGVRSALDAVKAVRTRDPKPADHFDAPPLPATSSIDASKLDAIFGVKGATKDGMYKATWGRTTSMPAGASVGKFMGVNTWAGVAGSDDNAAVDGDFAVLDSELQPVLKSLRKSGVNIVAIHHHMSAETPKILFLHYWGRGKAADLATAVKSALALTAWDGKK